MSDHASEPGPANLRNVGPPAPSLEGEAMRRRIGARLFGAPSEPLRIGRFRVQRSIGEGGMGIVYEAEDDTLDRRVAIKVIRPDAGGSRSRERERLLEEARALARLSHPNVISIYEVGEHGDEIFIAMEFVRGCTLLQWLRTSRTRAQIVDQFVAAGRGLAAAHAVGLVHRDFKPGNVLVGEDGRARIVDFGLARGPRVRSLQEAAISEPDSTSISEEPVPATESRAGTPGYMSPEQVLGQGCDARSDQFSFCVALHEALYGRRPFRKDVVAALVHHDVLRPPSSGEHGRVPGWLRRVLTRGLAFAPEARFASMDALLAALVRGSRSRTRWLLAGVTGLLVAAGVAGAALIQDAEAMCPSASEALYATWSPERREAVWRAFQATYGTGSPGGAEAAWSRLALPLDRYALAWSEASHATCVQARRRDGASERSLYARRLCLEERRQDLAEVALLIERRDPAVAGGARELVLGLRPIGDCDDPALDVQAIDGQREAARRTLGRVRQLQQRGLTEEALRGAAGLQVTARALGDRPLELEAMLMLGTIQARGRRDVEEAEATLLAAAGGISALGLAALAPAAWNELAYVAARLRGDAARADERLRLAELSGGERPDGLSKAALLETRSYAALLAGRTEEALELRREALKLREEMQPADHPDVARGRMLVANALAEHKQPALARALLEKLLADQVEALGPAHPSLLDVLESLAYAQLELKDGGAAATASLTRARAVATWLYGALSVRVAILDVSLAMVTADPAAAIDRLRGAIAVFTASGEPDYVERVAALQVLAELLRETRQTTAALAVNRELLLLHDRGFELEIDSVLVNIGDYLCELGRCEEAVAAYLRLQTLAEEDTSPGAAGLSLQGFGRVYLAQGRPRLALGVLERAREIFIHTPRPTQHMLEQTTRRLAECLALLGEPRRAKEMLAEADRLRAELGPE